jgi:polysaccharide deacetylase family protein (PEP-CTERM system associated)
MHNFLTIDLEDWFHLLEIDELSNVARWNDKESRVELISDILLELLNRNSVKATFFCLGWIGKKYPKLIRKIYMEGHTIASHGNVHKLVRDMTPDEFNVDTRTSIHTLEDVIGEKIIIFRAPGFSITQNEIWALNCLVDLGIKIDSSIFPAVRSHGGFVDFPSTTPCILDLNNGKIIEFPISTILIFNRRYVLLGGGYFRLTPLFAIEKIFKLSNYNMTYFHPRDFDEKQPRVRGLAPFRYFKSYVGLSSSLYKLEKLLSFGKFTSIDDFVKVESSSLKSFNFN